MGYRPGAGRRRLFPSPKPSTLSPSIESADVHWVECGRVAAAHESGSRRACHPPGPHSRARARGRLRRRGIPALLAHRRARLQQRRDGVRRPRRLDRQRSCDHAVLPDLPRAPTPLPDAALARLPRGRRRRPRTAARVRLRARDDRSRLSDRAHPLRTKDRPPRGALPGVDAIRRARQPAGPARRARDVLRGAHALHGREVQRDAQSVMAARDRRRDGPDGSLEGNEHPDRRRAVRVLRAVAGRRRASTLARRRPGRDAARCRGVSDRDPPRRTFASGAAIPRIPAVPAAEPPVDVLPRVRAACNRLGRRRSCTRGPVASPVAVVVAGDAAPELDRRPDALLPAVSGQGLPVPPADRARVRTPGCANARALAAAARGLAAVAARRRGGGVACPGDVAAAAAVAHRGLHCGHRRTAARTRARALDRGQRARGRRDRDDRALEREHRRVLRPAPRVRAVGGPEPTEAQPGVRPDPEPRPRHPVERRPVPRLGRVHRDAHAVLRKQAAALRAPLPRTRSAHRVDPRAHARGRNGAQADLRRLLGAPLMRFRALLPGLALLAAVAASTASAHSLLPTHRSAQARTPIKHVISILQENHTYDNYFGTYPHGDGLPQGLCVPVNPKRPSGTCVRPFHIGSNGILPRDLDHSSATARLQIDGGRMDGFVHPLDLRNQDGRLALRYRDGRDIPYYWNLADQYVLYDRFFSSAGAGSFLNHVYWVTGSAGSGYDRFPPGGYKNLATIFDRLEAAGVSWKVYVQNYSPHLNFRTLSRFRGNRASQVIWVPLLNMPRFIDNPELSRHIVDLDEYYRDLADGTLPAVSYIAPSGPSEHPPSNLQSGQGSVRSLINALVESAEWPTSAFLVAY